MWHIKNSNCKHNFITVDIEKTLRISIQIFWSLIIWDTFILLVAKFIMKELYYSVSRPPSGARMLGLLLGRGKIMVWERVGGLVILKHLILAM